MIDWMKYRWLYLLISGVVILSGVFSLFKWGLQIGVEFKGGTLVEYKFDKNPDENKLKKAISDQKIEFVSLQKTNNSSYVLKLGQVDPTQRGNLKKGIENLGLKVDESRFETIGPTVGPELVKKTVYGMLFSALGILLWVAMQFKSYKFGISAVLAMLHDSLVVIGMYSIFGHFFGAEVDLLFVTALLTILSFSVHDTIIVYDRIRESRKKEDSIYDLANRAVSETMVRSLNNSFVVIFMMVALLLMGGVTIRWFVATLLIGTISGAYSSPFVAVPILVTWDVIEKKFKHEKV